MCILVEASAVIMDSNVHRPDSVQLAPQIVSVRRPPSLFLRFFLDFRECSGTMGVVCWRVRALRE